jgi:hypothetical protein
MANRAQRRAFNKAVRGFAVPMGGWGEWRRVSTDSKLHFGIVPPRGLKKFVANDRFSVQIYEHQTRWGEVLQLLIRPNNGKPVRSWTEFQRIKNELVGSDRLAIEVFPPDSELVDEVNCYHLWVLPQGFELPFGLHHFDWANGISMESEHG